MLRAWWLLARARFICIRKIAMALTRWTRLLSPAR